MSARRFGATLRMPLDKLVALEKWPSRPFINSPHWSQFIQPSLELRSISGKQFEATLMMPLDKLAAPKSGEGGCSSIHQSLTLTPIAPADRFIPQSLELRSVSVKRFEAIQMMSFETLTASERWPCRLNQSFTVGPISPPCREFN